MVTKAPARFTEGKSWHPIASNPAPIFGFAYKVNNIEFETSLHPLVVVAFKFIVIIFTPVEVLKSLALGIYNGANGFAVCWIVPSPVVVHA